MAEVQSLILNVESNSVNKASKNLDGLSTSATRTETATTGATRATHGFSMALKSTIAPLALLTAGLVGLKKVVGTVADLEESLSAVEAVTGATAGEMRELEATARSLGKGTVFSASQAADAMQFLGMAGFETKEIISAMPGLLDLAAAGQLELARASDIASNVLSGFRLEAEETARVADVLAKAAASSNTNVEQLGNALSYAAPIAASFGITIEETAAAIGVLSDNGIQGQRAGTGLRTTMAALAAATPEATQALEALGLTMDQVNPQTNSLNTILKELNRAGLDAASAFQIFGRQGAPAILALTASVDRVDELTDSFVEAEGAASDMADTLSDNLAGSYKRLGSAADEFKLKLDESIHASDAWRATIDVLTESINDLSDSLAGGEMSDFAGLTDLNELIAAYDKVIDQQKAVAGDNKLLLTRIQLRKEILLLERQIGDATENEIALARAENTLDAFIEKEKELNVELKRGFLEMEGSYQLRLEAQQRQKESNDESIAYWREEIAFLKEAVSLEQARATTGAPAATTPASTVIPTATEPRQTKEFERLQLQLMTEEEAIETSYKTRLEIIRENTEEGSALRYDLETRAAEERNEALLAIEQERIDQENALQRSQLENFQQTTLLTATLMGQLTDLAEEGSSTQKILFATQKSIAIAQAIINTEMAATRALAEGGFVLGIPMSTAIRGLGYASVGVMAAQTIGSFASGGIIGGTSYTGDNLTANVNSGEMILNQPQQRRLFDIADGNQTANAGAAVNITVENYGSSQIEVQQITETDIRIIARDVAKGVVREDAPGVIASDIQNANGRTSKALAQNTKTERRR